MKLKFLKQVNSFLFVAAGVALLNASCSKVNDLYTKPDGDDDQTVLLPGGTVSNALTWSTSKSVDVRIAVADQLDGKYLYKVELYDREPHADDAVLLGAGLAKKGQDFISKVTIPDGLPYIFVKQTSPTNEVSYTMIEVKGNTAVADNGSSVAKVASVNARGLNLFAAATTFTTSVQKPVAPSVPAGAYVLEGNKTIDWSTANSNKIFVVKKGTTFTGEILYNSGISGITVYVEGTWDRGNAELVIGSGNTLIVLVDGQFKSGKLSLPSENITFTNFGKTTLSTLSANNTSKIGNHGTLAIEGTFNVPANTSVANTGTVTAKDMAISSNGTFNNSGSFTLKGTLELPSNSLFFNEGAATVQRMSLSSAGVVTNQGTLYVDVADYTNGTLNVNCLTTIGKMNVNGTEVNIATGARLDVNTLNSGGGKYNLSQGAMFDIKEGGSYTTQTNIVRGLAGSTKALIRYKSLKLEGYMSVKYEGNLQVAITKHPAGPDQWTPYYGAEPSVSFVDYAAVTVSIAATSCNAGGVNAPTTNPPGDQVLDQVVLGTYSYAFEDKWPSTGDYDMNDLVVDIQIVKYQTKDNKVKKVVLKNKIRSVGASIRLAGAVQLDNVLASAVKSVSYSNKNVVGKVLPLTGVGVENGQKQVVVTIVDDAHAAFGITNTAFISTQNGAFKPFETEVTIEFNTALDNFTYDDLNPFITNFVQNVGGRNEIHLVGRKATDKINTSLVTREQGKDGKLSSTDPFKTKNNYPFALQLPVSFKYPAEGVMITKVYPDMEEWIRSAGTKNQNWFTNYRP